MKISITSLVVAVAAVAAVVAVVACGGEEPALPPVTRSALPCDSTSDSLVHYGAVSIDTAWAGERHVRF